MTTILVDRAQLEQWLQAFKKIHGDKRSHWDVDEEISAIEKSLEPIAMDVMKTDEADFWRWWKPYQLKDCWRLELVARDAWMASKATLKPKEQETKPLHEITDSQIMASVNRAETAFSESRPIGQQWDLICNLVRVVLKERGYYAPQLKEPEQEPVAKAVVSKRKTDEHHITDIDLTLTEAGKRLGSGEHCLYTTPPQRKPLTDEQVREIAKGYALSLAFPYDGKTTPEMFSRAIEAAHGIKE